MRYAEGTDVGILLVHGDFNIVERILKTAEQIKPKFGVLWDVQRTRYMETIPAVLRAAKASDPSRPCKDHHRADGAFVVLCG